jgi:hypothetical protein
MSTTGLGDILNNKGTAAIIYDDCTCPNCDGGILRPIYNRIDKKYILTRYQCSNCDFTCPVYHDREYPIKTNPVYDKSIKEFFSGFGEDINIRIRNLFTRREKNVDKKV